MSCYLCAYGRSEAPQSHQALPEASPADAHAELATCSKCSVWACSAHGTRYGLFECAICTPASAVVTALTASPANGAAAAMAHRQGVNTTPVLLQQTQAALQKIVSASHAPATQQADIRFLVAPGQGEPNLVSNLADVIRRQDESAGLFTARATQFEGQGFGSVSIDAVGAAVWARFSGSQLAAPTADATRIASGALQQAYGLAAPGTVISDAREFPPPWQVARPIFLDPVLWLLATALRED